MRNASPRVVQALEKIEKIIDSLSETDQEVTWCRLLLARPALLIAFANEWNLAEKVARRFIRAYLRELEASSHAGK